MEQRGRTDGRQLPIERPETANSVAPVASSVNAMPGHANRPLVLAQRPILGANSARCCWLQLVSCLIACSEREPDWALMPDSYPYEQLDGPRFQRLAQTLLVSEHPGLQCFPLSGADGGRDAAEMLATESTRLVDSLVFQVKFREQQPLGVPTTRNLYKWLTDSLIEELPNLRELASRGTREYVVITNIKGTGTLDTGLRDKINDWCSKNLPLITRFWWRDDLDARLLGRYDLIFHFNLFTGTEAVRAFLEESYRNQAEPSDTIRISNRSPAVTALLAYIADQHRIESTLRFEQADLPSSPILDFFIDVQAEFSRATREAKPISDWISSTEKRLGQFSETPDSDGDAYANHFSPTRQSDFSFSTTSGAGTAELMLSGDIPTKALRTVLQGAPGQGKSTLGQYICQVHRARLLRHEGDQAKLPSSHRHSPLRLPIRVELKHLATWFTGMNPWTSERESASQSWAKSLESFIAAHIRYSSGGMILTITDLCAILSRTPSFIFLDGLDEIADIELRRTIVEAVEASLGRLEALGADMQVVVTSRPAIFVKAPGFSQKGFLYLALSTLNRQLINRYTDVWINARDMPEDRARELRHVLDTNLEQSHVAELARNPMQLAILLWLIYVKGWSLPNKRTALYEQYLTAALDRESKKSVAVLETRDRLMEIHGYLGWVLHCRAESANLQYASGDITSDELRELITSFLIYEQRSTDLVGKLIEGTERVYVLVSRIEGKHEFAVQPLREFFAARFLYKTAPNSTSADPANGALPDRLEQLVRNPYWLNVARFFCGWYDKGELAGLSRQLRDLCQDSDYRLLGHPRYLIACILQDYTVAESQRDIRELVAAMSDDLGLRLLTGSGGATSGVRRAPDEPLLPIDGGREFYVECLRNAMLTAKTEEEATDLSIAIGNNDPPESRARWWLGLEQHEQLSRLRWLRRGVQASCMQHISLDDALRLFDPTNSSRLDWVRCVESGRFDVAFHDADRLERFIEILGEGFSPLIFSYRQPIAGDLWTLPFVLDADWLFAARENIKSPAIHWPGEDNTPPQVSPSLRSRVEALRGILPPAEHNDGVAGVSPLAQSLAMLSEKARAVFGESWAAWRAALICGTIPRQSTKKSVSFFDTGSLLSERARRARLSSRDLAFWQSAIAEVDRSFGARMALCAALFSWADPDILQRVLPLLYGIWNDFTSYDMYNLYFFINSMASVSGVGQSAPKRLRGDIFDSMPDIPASMCSLLVMRCEDSAQPAILDNMYRQLPDMMTSQHAHSGLVADVLLGKLFERFDRNTDPRSFLHKVKFVYGASIRTRSFTRVYRGLFGITRKTQAEIARSVLSAPREFPQALVINADLVAGIRVGNNVRPLAAIANEQKWLPGLPC